MDDGPGNLCGRLVSAPGNDSRKQIRICADTSTSRNAKLEQSEMFWILAFKEATITSNAEGRAGLRPRVLQKKWPSRKSTANLSPTTRTRLPRRLTSRECMRIGSSCGVWCPKDFGLAQPLVQAPSAFPSSPATHKKTPCKLTISGSSAIAEPLRPPKFFWLLSNPRSSNGGLRSKVDWILVAWILGSPGFEFPPPKSYFRLQT